MSTTAEPTTRLQQLLDIRDRLNADIAREMGRQRSRHRIAATGRSTYAATRADWTAQLVAAAAVHYSITPDALRSPARDSVTTEARAVAAWMLRQAGRSLTEIGREFGRHHTTIMHATRWIERTPDAQETARRLYRALTEGDD